MIGENYFSLSSKPNSSKWIEEGILQVYDPKTDETITIKISERVSGHDRLFQAKRKNGNVLYVEISSYGSDIRKDGDKEYGVNERPKLYASKEEFEFLEMNKDLKQLPISLAESLILRELIQIKNLLRNKENVDQ